MRVDIIPILSTIVLMAIAMTIILAVASYVVFRLRDLRKRRRDRDVKGKQKSGPKYFEKYNPKA
jgi:hypothetical protein